MNKSEEQVINDLKNKGQAWARILLRYIEKIQKENEELKTKINKVLSMIDDNYRSEWYDDYETIAGLRDDIYDLLMIKYRGVKD